MTIRHSVPNQAESPSLPLYVTSNRSPKSVTLDVNMLVVGFKPPETLRRSSASARAKTLPLTCDGLQSLFSPCFFRMDLLLKKVCPRSGTGNRTSLRSRLKTYPDKRQSKADVT
jgi:hypothetical protein